jgi:uncharacterized surface protein with fasciclin (FAS1) repeats
MKLIATAFVASLLLGAAASAAPAVPALQTVPAAHPTMASLTPKVPLSNIIEQPTERGDVLAIAQAQGNLTTFVRLIKAAGLASTLSHPGPYTVFAPSDAAFGRMPASKLSDLERPGHETELKALLSYHIAHGEITTANMSGRQSVETLQGAELTITATMKSVEIGNATLVKGDLFASNGVVHIIDNVLVAPERPNYIAKRN